MTTRWVMDVGKGVPMAGCLKIELIQVVIRRVRIVKKDVLAYFAVKKARIRKADFPTQRKNCSGADAISGSNEPFGSDQIHAAAVRVFGKQVPGHAGRL